MVSPPFTHISKGKKMKFLFATLALLTVSHAPCYSSEYRYAHRLSFEAEGYSLYSFNHEARSLVKITERLNKVVSFNYVEVYADHYVIEAMKIDCKNKTSISTDQYESWNDGPEKHYAVDGGWEPINTSTGVGDFGSVRTDLHYSLYKSVCKGH